MDNVWISEGYASKGTARQAAISHAAKSGWTNFCLIVDGASKLFHFSRAGAAVERVQLVFAKYKLVRGKWREVGAK